jgi:hypothetical protein
MWRFCMPSPHGRRPYITTTAAAFDRATPSSVGAAPIPFPRPASVPADRVIGPRRLSMGSLGPAVCHPRLGVVPQSGCTDSRAFTIRPSGAEGGEEEDDEHCITVVTGPIGVPPFHHTTHNSIGPRGWPQGPLSPRIGTTLPTSPTPSLAASEPLPAFPSSEAGPSGSRTPPVLKSLCSSRLLRWFNHHAVPSGKGRAPGSWDSMAGPSQ